MSDIVFSGHQPNFIPYMGVFYKIFKADKFVLDDDVQYSSKGLHNSNFLRVNNAKYKVSIPVTYNFGDKINEVKISYEKKWDEKLLRTLSMSYGNCRYFTEGYELIQKYIKYHPEMLCDLNIALLKEICQKFGLKSQIYIASNDVPTELVKNDRNIYQCKSLGCNIYYSGIGGKEYNDVSAYNKENIEVIYTDYQPVRYKQSGYPFIENLSVLDWIFNKGYELPEEWIK